MEAKRQKLEIERLADMLDEAHIPYSWSRDAVLGAQIEYPCHGERRVASVIQGPFTYGNEDNRLELMGLMTDAEREEDQVAGWLTAEEVMRRIGAHWALARNRNRLA